MFQASDAPTRGRGDLAESYSCVCVFRAAHEAVAAPTKQQSITVARRMKIDADRPYTAETRHLDGMSRAHWGWVGLGKGTALSLHPVPPKPNWPHSLVRTPELYTTRHAPHDAPSLLA